MAKVMKTMDGNTAASHVAYAFTDVAAIFPITPSSTMAEMVDEWSANGRKNLFGQTVQVVELQSEAGAAGALHGSLSAGALTTTFTASQGLLLMIPNMYKVAGEFLPGVFHVSARAVASHALSIFGDHSDVMATRQTGFALLAAGSVQEVMDMAAVAHLSAIKSSVPFLHFFDGFRTSAEIQKIEIIEQDDLGKLLDWEAVARFRNNSLNPEHPKVMGTAQNPDIFFQAREASNPFYNRLPDIVSDYMAKISALTGREYRLFNYYGAPDAENVIVAMGSITECAEETVDYLNSKGQKVGLIKVHLYRPFSAKHLLNVLPKTVKRIAVLDRTKEPGAPGDPLYLDIQHVFYGQPNAPLIISGRYGLGSKDTTPSQVCAVYSNLASSHPKDKFTIGIKDDVTMTSLDDTECIRIAPEGTIRCKFWGLGSDGTVGANKNSIKIIGDETDLYAQGYFAYDSKKSGGVTISHLRFGKKPIKSTYLIDEADFIACHNQAYVHQYDLLKGLKAGGIFLFNTQWTVEDLEKHLPSSMKQYLANNKIKFYTINATDIAEEIGLGNRINMIMQSAFFKLAKVIDIDKAISYMKEAVLHTYGKKGEKIIQMNYAAIDKGIEGLHEITIPESWKSTEDQDKQNNSHQPDFIRNILNPMNRQEGDNLPVSAFSGRENGCFPMGTSAYEKRGIAIHTPEWQAEHCIQCNHCSYVCPHAAIRPFLLTEEELSDAPKTLKSKKAIGKGLENLNFKIQVSPMDCTGCGNCADVCPSKEKSLVMKPIHTQEQEIEHWNWISKLPEKSVPQDPFTVKGSQFIKPLLEFSGACAGCGETPYTKLITQLFGDRMLIANATGCSSIWGASAPSIPYCVNDQGKGPAWANSLFEDNAEYGFGMALGIKQIRNRIADRMTQLSNHQVSEELKQHMQAWIRDINLAEASKEHSQKVLSLLKQEKASDPETQRLIEELISYSDYYIKKSVWVFGGDGWAYDIGYGGLDHVVASGEDINLLVLDTEVYSNTGGQSSKSTPTAAIAKFAASGKKAKKKDLGMMAMSYGYVYVAQVAMGADKNHLVKVLKEAESYQGPSLVIAYAPCINHGIKYGMGKTIEQEKLAVEAGYWHLYRYNPLLKEEGKNPFVLDSKPPTASFRDFIMSEIRYSSLKLTFPDLADQLFDKAEKDAKERMDNYLRLANR
ncbi:MAG TPA: pyruvate:ferredoxin (flavodoxin) oxidoreductase [Caldisericia bacterium]|mgnify:CR=1 FL=1|nr:pyruvate:ferredoxin (flavodoxin) oxidoreductase [Caldisericia bacterium]